MENRWKQTVPDRISGAVTVLFADIEGNTERRERDRRAMAPTVEHYADAWSGLHRFRYPPVAKLMRSYRHSGLDEIVGFTNLAKRPTRGRSNLVSSVYFPGRE